MSGKEGMPGYLTPGMTVGPYLVEGQVGGGGFGFVYRVRRDGQAYALKIAHSKLSSLPPEERAATIERLDREIAALKSLHHPNIVRVHSFERWPDLEGGYPYLVMDLVDGAPLQGWREAASPSLARLVAVFEKVADALAHMHQLGIIHRDLKSQNILVTGDGEPYIVDFGIARPRIAYDITRASGVGTLTHLTPEYVAFLDSAEARSGRPFDWLPTTDLYALGYVLYEALTGQPPVPRFADGTAKEEFELLAAIKGEVPRRPRDLDPRVPKVLDALVMELLEKDPAKRVQEAAQVVERLAAAREAGEAAGDRAWTYPFDAGDEGAPATAGREDAGEELPPIESAAGAVRPEGAKAPMAAEQQPRPRPPARPPSGRARPEVSLPAPDQAAEFEEVEPPSAKQPDSPADWSKESQILKRVAAEWGRAQPKPWRWKLLVAAGAGAVVLLLLVPASWAPVDRPQPKTLLSAVEAGALPPASPPSVPLVEQPSALQAQPAPGRAEPLREEREAPKMAARAPAAEPARGADRVSEEEVARGRLTLLPDGQVVLRRSPPAEEPSGIVRSRPFDSEPGVLLRSRRVATEEAAAPQAPKPRGAAFGAHIQARLLTNLDTRTIANGPVEALLHVPYVVRGQVVLPTRTMVYGTATESGGRFTVRFHRLRLPDDTEMLFEGIALARDDGKPGLAASGRVGQEPKRADGLGSKIAKGTGNILLDTITGGTPASIARNAGQAAVNHEEQQPVGGGQWALLLDAGVVFDIFVEKAF